MRPGMLDNHVVIRELVALRQIKPVKDALQPFTREIHVNVVPRQPRAEGE